MRVKCLSYEHNTMYTARAQPQTAQSRDECTNHKATVPPQKINGEHKNMKMPKNGFPEFDFSGTFVLKLKAFSWE